MLTLIDFQYQNSPSPNIKTARGKFPKDGSESSIFKWLALLHYEKVLENSHLPPQKQNYKLNAASFDFKF